MRKPLSAQEVNYWKLNLSRILKIGAEFEFNLPDKPTGTCKGKSFTCPCVKYANDAFDCWTKCLHEKECSAKADLNRCSNHNTEICNSKCDTCTNYSFKCNGHFCSNNIPACVTCATFSPNCDGCLYRFDPNTNPNAIRQACINQFVPSGSYGVVSRSGVHNITTDGSLLGQKGMEIITTGRRVDFWEFYEMAKNIIDTSVGKGAYTNERCSIHMHGLASYYGKVTGTGAPQAAAGGSGPSGKVNELERSVPEIVLANLHQLLRRYQNAITWMTSGLDNPKHLTRWEKFRVSILDISAIADNMRAVRDKVSSNAGGNKYSWANYKFCEFDENGDVKRLHVELRVMDGLLSPSAVAAFSCLYYALFIKAVELSRYGVMEVGDDDWNTQAKKVKDALFNNCADWQEGTKNGRFSDTSQLSKYTNILVKESFELISQLKHILSHVGPAYDVLEKLADNPCSMRRCAGVDWTAIEQDLAVKLTEEGKLEYEVRKLIDTRAITGLNSREAWLIDVASVLKANKELGLYEDSIEEIADKVAIHIDEKQSNGDMIWAGKIGTMITV